MKFSRMREAQVVRVPRVQSTSLTATGMPVSAGVVVRIIGGEGGIGRAGLLQRALRRNREVGVDLRLDAFDAVEHGLGEFG